MFAYFNNDWEGFAVRNALRLRRSVEGLRHDGMDDDIRWALTETRTWAVVGLLARPGRDSHRIAALLQRRGFR